MKIKSSNACIFLILLLTLSLSTCDAFSMNTPKHFKSIICVSNLLWRKKTLQCLKPIILLDWKVDVDAAVDVVSEDCGFGSED